tara:strand:+ start:59 stop:382 length:324 start_codon:yes stop_codon:yes gene_type:complete
MSKDKSKISYFRLQEMVEDGTITKHKAQQMIDEGKAAGEKRKESSIKFADTTMTTYYPPITFKASKAKGNENSNIVTNDMVELKAKYEEETRPIFNRLINEYSVVSG